MKNYFLIEKGALCGAMCITMQSDRSSLGSVASKDPRLLHADAQADLCWMHI